jgi:hypothetical protein
VAWEAETGRTPGTGKGRVGRPTRQFASHETLTFCFCVRTGEAVAIGSHMSGPTANSVSVGLRVASRKTKTVRDGQRATSIRRPGLGSGATRPIMWAT